MGRGLGMSLSAAEFQTLRVCRLNPAGNVCAMVLGAIKDMEKCVNAMPSKV